MRRSAATRRTGQRHDALGANRFSGTAYEFFRNGALDARNHFAPETRKSPSTTATVRRARSAGRSRNRTFFFADYERTRLREGSRASPTCRRPRSAPATSRSRCAAARSAHRTAVSGARIRRSSSTRSARRSRRCIRCRTAHAACQLRSSPTQQRDDIHQFDVKLDHNVSTALRLTGRYSSAIAG